MDKKLIEKIISKGKLLFETKSPAFTESSPTLIDVCEGLVKAADQDDSVKLKESNPYFNSDIECNDIPAVIVLVIGFDNKKGSIIESTYPKQYKLLLQSPEYESFGKKICFAAIPDSVHKLEVIYS